MQPLDKEEKYRHHGKSRESECGICFKRLDKNEKQTPYINNFINATQKSEILHWDEHQLCRQTEIMFRGVYKTSAPLETARFSRQKRRKLHVLGKAPACWYFCHFEAASAIFCCINVISISLHWCKKAPAGLFGSLETARQKIHVIKSITIKSKYIPQKIYWVTDTIFWMKYKSLWDRQPFLLYHNNNYF